MRFCTDVQNGVTIRGSNPLESRLWSAWTSRPLESQPNGWSKAGAFLKKPRGSGKGVEPEPRLLSRKSGEGNIIAVTMPGYPSPAVPPLVGGVYSGTGLVSEYGRNDNEIRESGQATHSFVVQPLSVSVSPGQSRYCGDLADRWNRVMPMIHTPDSRSRFCP